MNYRDVNRVFVDYYVNEGFDSLLESSLLDPSVPMSFVMSVGLVQVENSPSEKQLFSGSKFVLVQPCFRYFDMSRVGKSSVHLSLFHMPGAFTFGPEDRTIVVNRMWTLLTKELGLRAERLWITYFDGTGDLDDRLNSDEESKRAWLSLDINPNQLVPMGARLNFWRQGGGINGLERKRKCGPNTEVFYDLAPERACGADCLPGCECGRFVEIANTLFVEHEIDVDAGRKAPLSLPFAETVIGSERVAMVLQAKDCVFEIAALRSLMATLNEIVLETQVDTVNSIRIVIDHIRAIYFLVADGAVEPGKGGRPRLMRKLIRSVLSHEIVLGLEDDSVRKLLLEKLAACENLSANPKELLETINSYFELEAVRFRKVIEKGQRLVDKMVQTQNGESLSGRKIIELEKSHGVPVVLIRMMLQQRGLHYPTLSYERELEKWKSNQ